MRGTLVDLDGELSRILRVGEDDLEGARRRRAFARAPPKEAFARGAPLATRSPWTDAGFWTNQNTTYLLFSTPIVRVQLARRPSATPADPTEPIARPDDRLAIFRSPREIAALIASGRILCGFTKSAFATHISSFMQHLLP